MRWSAAATAFGIVIGSTTFTAPPGAGPPSTATAGIGHVPAATVLTLDGTRLGPGIPAPTSQQLRGSWCQTPYTCTAIDYPAGITPLSVTRGVWALDKALEDISGETTVFGYSQGAMIASEWLADYADGPDAPDPDELSFVLIGNHTRAHGGSLAFLGQTMPETQYKVTDIARQYDIVADFPDNPFNLVALANAAAGFIFVHLDYTNVNVEDPNNITWTEGNTTYVFVPTEDLPLLEPLRLLGMNKLADKLNDPLKAVVEAGYNRHLPQPDTALQERPETPPDLTGAQAVDAEQEPEQEPEQKRSPSKRNLQTGLELEPTGDTVSRARPSADSSSIREARGVRDSIDDRARVRTVDSPARQIRDAVGGERGGRSAVNPDRRTRGSSAD